MTPPEPHSILFVAAEVSPHVSVGGLAEVVRFLPRALREAGHDVRIAVPDYQPLLRHVSRRVIADRLPVRVGNDTCHPVISEAQIDEDTPVYFVGGAPGFDGISSAEADVYRKPTATDYAILAKTILEFLRTDRRWTPRILHLHDSHAAFASMYLTTSDYVDPASPNALRTVFTIHNLGFSVSFDRTLLATLGLPPSLDRMEGIEFFGRLSALKAGIVLSDMVTTVSPTYALEILSHPYGERLEGVLRSVHEQSRLRGILNGVDRVGLAEEARRGEPAFTLTRSFDDFVTTKKQLRATLCEKYGLLHDEERPVLAIAGRWGWQKGWPLFAELLLNGHLADFTIVIETWASAGQDPELMEGLRDYATRHSDTVVVVEGQRKNLLRLAAADFVLLPSLYEPCGLVQMEAMCFGTVPIVRKTGGLADTVFDGENGMSFEAALWVDDLKTPHTAAFFQAVQAMGSTLRKALSVFRNPSRLSEYQKACFYADNSWRRRVPSYEQLYGDVLASTRASSGALQTR